MDNIYVIAPTDSDLQHHGILGMHWGRRNGPPYPLDGSSHSASEKKAGWRKSLSSGKGIFGRRKKAKADRVAKANAKKIVEVDMAEKGTSLHESTVVGDTVGDPFKDTSSVAMNPIIKFTTLFGLLAMEIAIAPAFREYAKIAGFIFLFIALIFVVRSFYAMRIPQEDK